MKIAFLVRSLDCGGAERQLVLLAKALHRRGHEVSVTSFYGSGFYEQTLRESSIRVNTAGRAGRWDFLRPLVRVLGTLRGEKADVIHSYMNLGNLVTGSFKWRLRPARIVWGLRSSAVDLREYGSLSCLGTRLERLLSFSADAVISNSKAGLEAAKGVGFPADRLVSIPNGIDPTEFSRNATGRQEVRAELGIKEDELLIGRVGRLDPVKDYPTFLKAAAAMAKRDHRLRFACIGSGPAKYAEELQRLTHELGLADRVTWTGLAKGMRDMYNALDLLVSSSKSGEGFPNVLLEAMACGVPCVSTDVGDCRELVADTGITVPPSDPALLAEACLKLLDERQSSDWISNFAIQRYNVDILVTRTEKVLFNLTGLNAPSDLNGLSATLDRRSDLLIK